MLIIPVDLMYLTVLIHTNQNIKALNLILLLYLIVALKVWEIRKKANT